ncbi:putative ribonuclease H-like domain-containing protein [Tanacetum coccineum]
MCDKKNKVLFTDTECFVLSSDFKLPDENQVLLRIPRQNNMYSFNLENIVPSGGLACLIAKATIDESNKWHRRLGHVNFKNLNKLVKGNLVRGLPSKIFQNDHTCVACQKGKQHKASCKAKIVSSISQPLQLLHMDLFGPTSVRSINHKTYCLVITDDFSRFSWVFFLRTKDETSGILKDFIRQIENQLNQKVKTIRCDNGTEFKNMDIIEFCGSKGIKREYSNARTPQQNGVAERKNRTLIEAARTMLADSFLPNTFWAEAVSTACYVLNRVLVTKPQNKTPYELITGPEEANYSAGTQDNIDAGNSKMEADPAQDYFVLPIYSSYTSIVKSSEAKNEGEKSYKDTGLKINEEPVDQEDQAFLEELKRLKRQEKEANNAAEALSKKFAKEAEDLLIQAGAARATIQTKSKVHKSSGAHAFVSYIQKHRRNNHKDFQHCLFAYFLSQIEPKKISEALEDESWVDAMQEELLQFKIQEVWTLVDLLYRKKVIRTKWVYRNKKDERGVVVRHKARLVTQGYRQEEGIDYDEVFAPMARIESIRIFLAFTSYMGFIVYHMDVKSAFLYGIIDEEVYVSQPPCFIDPKFPKKVYKVVKDLYGLHQAPRAWYATLSTFLLKSGYRKGTIDKTLFIKKDKNDIMLVQVYVDDMIFGSTKRSWCDKFEALMKSRFQMSFMGELTFFLGLQVKQKEDGIFISQDKYVAEILKKFDFASVKTANTPIETHKSLVKDEEAADVDVHLYRSMIRYLMYLTAFRPDIMFAVCACSRFQVTSKTSHLNAVKRIFRYLKGKPKLGLWYPRVSSFDLEAYSDSDYDGANLDRKSTTRAASVQGRQVSRLRATYGAKLVSAASLINTARPTLSTVHTKVEVKQEGNTKSTRKRPGRTLKIKATKKSKRQKTDSDLEEEEQLKAFLMIVPDEEGEINYEVLNRRYLIVNRESKFYHTDRYGKPHDYYRVFRADGSLRYIKTFNEMVSSLRTMFEANAKDDLWKYQEAWILKSWNLYDKCRVHILVLEDGTEFYMLAERRYPLTKETLERMLALRLIAKSESEAIFDLLRYIQQQIDEYGSHDGSEKDL